VVVAAAVATGNFVIVDRHGNADAAVVTAVNSALAGHSADISLTGSGSAEGSSISITGTGASTSARTLCSYRSISQTVRST
jgi:hypothetical protein